MMNLNETTHRVLANKIESAKSNVPLEIARMIDDAKHGRDFMIKLGHGLQTNFYNNENGVCMSTPIQDFRMHENAVNQIGGKYGISVRELNKYIKGTFSGGKEWQDEMVAHILNEHSKHARQERFLIRAVNDEIRGVLSDIYRILDSQIILTEFIKVASQKGAVFSGGYYNGLKVWIEMIMPEAYQIATENNGDVDVAFGLQARTSEYGVGMLELRGFVMNAWCANMATHESVIHHRHVGEKLPDNFEFAHDTIIANSKKIKLEVRDYTKYLLSEGYMRNRMIQINEASKIKVDVKKEMDKLYALGFLKKEVEDTEAVLLNNRREDGVQGESTLWKLTQAITAMAKHTEPERERELSEIAGGMLPNLPMNKQALIYTN